MKRKIFFWLDRLQISRSERIAVSTLMIALAITVSVTTFIDPSPAVDTEHYAELERIFNERSALRQSEHDAIMARYSMQTNQSSDVVEKSLKAKSGDISEQQTNNSALNDTPVVTDTTKVNINTATADELQQLPGIGPAYSERIIEWRNTNGKFTSVDQLLEIKGIGPVRLEKIRSFIRL